MGDQRSYGPQIAECEGVVLITYHHNGAPRDRRMNFLSESNMGHDSAFRHHGTRQEQMALACLEGDP
jgi:hypothetical protein